MKEPDDRFICLMAACFSPLAVFLAVEEVRDKKTTRLGHFSLRSSALFAVFVLWTLICLFFSRILTGVPILGFVTELVLWVLYLAGVLVLLSVRVRMMHAAWQNEDYALPLLEDFIQDHFHM